MHELMKLIDAAIDGGAVGQDEIAEKVTPNLDDDMRGYLVDRGLRLISAERLRTIRNEHGAARDPQSGDDKYALVRKLLSADPLRWQVAKRGGGHINYGDCTRDDVLWLADEYRLRAQRNMSHAERYQTVADEMVKAKAAKVAELDAEFVRRVMLG